MMSRQLTVISYDDETGKGTRVTLALPMIFSIIAAQDKVEMFERSLNRTNVIGVDGSSLELYINDLDLISLEQAVGFYIME